MRFIALTADAETGALSVISMPAMLDGTRMDVMHIEVVQQEIRRKDLMRQIDEGNTLSIFQGLLN